VENTIGNYRPKRPICPVGGQHRASIGVSTFDLTNAERQERLDREGVDRRVATDDYSYLWPGSASEREALSDFEAERKRLAGTKGQPF